MDRLDREFNFVAESARRTARVQQGAVERFLDAAPRWPALSRPAAETSSETLTLDDKPRRGWGLAKHLHGAYDALIAHVEQRIVDYGTLPDAESKAGALTEMRQMVEAARDLHSSLGLLDAAYSPPLDLGTRYLVDWTASTLVAGDAEVTVVAATDRSYATVTNPLEMVFRLPGATPPDGKMIVVVVYVPRGEQHSGLLHPLIIHELGHAANKQHGLMARVFKTERGDEILSALIGEAEKQAKTSVSGEMDGGARAEAVAARLGAWIEEAVCDAIAAHILGPTYLYSFMAIVGTSDLDAAGEDHPPTRQRIRLLLNQLDSLGWTELLANAAPAIDTWFRETARQEAEYDEQDVAFCVAALARLSKEIIDVVMSHLDGLVFRAQDFHAVRKEIGELLKQGIPPCQTLKRTAIGRAEIILGSWLFAVEKQGGDLEALAVAADVPELSRLLPKALQDAALLEAWESR